MSLLRRGKQDSQHSRKSSTFYRLGSCIDSDSYLENSMLAKGSKFSRVREIVELEFLNFLEQRPRMRDFIKFKIVDGLKKDKVNLEEMGLKKSIDPASIREDFYLYLSSNDGLFLHFVINICIYCIENKKISSSVFFNGSAGLDFEITAELTHLKGLSKKMIDVVKGYQKKGSILLDVS
jgi:hypothetical protein